MSVAAALNRLSIWRRPVRVWDLAMTPPTLDRWLYLQLHRAGRMGAAERHVFDRLVRPGMQVVDVGANIGLYSLLLARLAGPTGRMYAFEPDPLMAAALRHNVAVNGGGVEVFECAVGAEAGEGQLRRHAWNSGDNRMTMGSGAAVRVGRLGDLLGDARVDVIKIDVQGWESQVLMGLGPLLDRNPELRIYFEFWPWGLEQAGTSVDAFGQLLERLGLRLWRPLGEPVDIGTAAAELSGRAFTNLLASRTIDPLPVPATP